MAAVNKMNRGEVLTPNEKRLAAFASGEGFKQSVRRSQVKAAERAKSIAPPLQPHATVLMTRQRNVKALLSRNSSLVSLFNNLDGVAVIDTGAGKSKWNGGKNASKSRDGTDLKKLSIFSYKSQQWLNVSMRGGDKERNGVMARVTRWKKGGWGFLGKKEKSSTLQDDTVTEEEAQELVVEFVGSATLIEYGSHSSSGSVDAKRINSWMEIYETEHSLSFYNLGDLCFVNNPETAAPNSCLFGPGGSIIQTGVAKLAIISELLFEVGAIKSTVGSPYLTEVETEVYSEEELDVQLLMNLFMVLRNVYLAPAVIASSSSASSSSTSASSSSTSASSYSSAASSSSSDKKS
jgi:hypothetical protein